jgi:hypothetical protein
MLKHFNYWLTGCGWAEVFFTSDQQAIRFEFSYLSDPLADLVSSLLQLLSHSQNETIVDFYDEPGHFRLTMALIGDANLRLEIRTSMETEGTQDILQDWKRYKPVFELTDTLNNICTVVYAGIVDLKKRHGEAEYFKQWLNYPFPSDQFKLLEQAVSNMK